MNILAIIPARGGSKGIPRKNVRMLSGRPLISYAIQNASSSKYSIDVCVSTDDDEIERVARFYSAEVVRRGERLSTDDITLDPVIYDAYLQMSKLKDKNYEIVVTLQPTSPLMTVDVLNDAIDLFISSNVDTLISAVNTPHLSWTENTEGKIIPAYEERVNRQYLPKHFTETGAFIITRAVFMKENSRLGKEISIYEMPPSQAIDIDTPQDWWIAEKELNKKSILIRVEGYSAIGLGHIYRGLSLANNLIDHDIRFIISLNSQLGIEKLAASNFKYSIIEHDEEIGSLIEEYHADILINDILNTTTDYMEYLKQYNIKIVNFEDLGDGADLADIVINDLYASQREGGHYYWGSDYYIIRDEFLLSNPSQFNSEVNEILVLFGGVDPSNLSEKLFQAIQKIEDASKIKFTFIVGLGYPFYDELKAKATKIPYNIDVVRDVKIMTEYMKKADIAIASQGRTMLELAAMAVPTILLAQNERELTHEFGYMHNGFINLGLGENLTIETIAETLNWLINARQIREQMHEQMKLNDVKNGLNRVLKLILE